MIAAMTTLPVLGVPVQITGAQGPRQPAVDRADAGRRAGRHARHRRAGRDQRRRCSPRRSWRSPIAALSQRLEAWRAARTAVPSSEAPERALLQPGGTIGILGGGQLGRMLALAAAQLGYRVPHLHAGTRQRLRPKSRPTLPLRHLPIRWRGRRFAQACDVRHLRVRERARTGRWRSSPSGSCSRACARSRSRRTGLREKSFVESLGGRGGRRSQRSTAADELAACDRAGRRARHPQDRAATATTARARPG